MPVPLVIFLVTTLLVFVAAVVVAWSVILEKPNPGYKAVKMAIPPRGMTSAQIHAIMDEFMRGGDHGRSWAVRKIISSGRRAPVCRRTEQWRIWAKQFGG